MQRVLTRDNERRANRLGNLVNCCHALARANRHSSLRVLHDHSVKVRTRTPPLALAIYIKSFARRIRLPARKLFLDANSVAKCGYATTPRNWAW
jgi:hypothetical protein